MSENNTQDAARRLMALPAWYEQFCPGPHPYAKPDGRKQDSTEIMAAVSADIRTVCGALAELREDKARLDSGVILITHAPDEWGATRTMHQRRDLRVDIDAARKDGGK